MSGSQVEMSTLYGWDSTEAVSGISVHTRAHTPSLRKEMYTTSTGCAMMTGDVLFHGTVSQM